MRKQMSESVAPDNLYRVFPASRLVTWLVVTRTDACVEVP